MRLFPTDLLNVWSAKSLTKMYFLGFRIVQTCANLWRLVHTKTCLICFKIVLKPFTMMYYIRTMANTSWKTKLSVTIYIENSRVIYLSGFGCRECTKQMVLINLDLKCNYEDKRCSKNLFPKIHLTVVISFVYSSLAKALIHSTSSHYFAFFHLWLSVVP